MTMPSRAMQVVVVPHDPAWAAAFELAAAEIRRALGQVVVQVHHIGSTAIPGIWAKPILDLLVEASSLEILDRQLGSLVALGYESLGEFGIPGRRYFRRNDAAGRRTHQIHVFLAGSPQVARHLNFRDYLRAHRQPALAYSDLKRRLAEQFPSDIASYCDGKDALIQDIDRLAAAWRAG